MDPTVTDRTTLLAALAAAAVLAFPAAQAHADTTPPEPETIAGDPQATAVVTPAEDESQRADAIAAEGAFSAQTDTVEQPAAPAPPAEPPATAEAGDEGGSSGSEATLPAEKDTTSPPVEASVSSPSEASGPAAENGSTVSVLVPADETLHGVGGAANPSISTGGAAKPSAHPPPPATPPSPKDGHRTVGGLEELLPQLDRELGAVQSEIDRLRRGLDNGLVPSAGRLRHLRSSLHDLAPTLLALGTQLHGADQLSPRLRRLLTRVRSRLGTVRASSADLSRALRSSGVGGAELRRLLRELERFGELSAPLGLPAANGRAATIRAAAAMAPPAPLAGARPPAVAPPRARHADGPANGAPHPGRAETDPRSSAPGSASAAPAGAFAAAGLALLALMFVRLALSRLRVRLDLPPCRGYAVAFLTPLERPG
jgi:hypothetical protein